MRRCKDATVPRRALEARLKQESDGSGTDLGRLRRRVVFDRLAVRLSVDGEAQWVLKSGAALAVTDGVMGGATLRNLLMDSLAIDLDCGWFSFRVKEPVALAVDNGGRGAWRFCVEVWLTGKQFAGVRLEVTARGEGLALTERLDLAGTLTFAGAPTRSIEAVEQRQHFAENLHALTRDNGDRPNTRVKDLFDLVLVIEDGLLADKILVDVVRRVFTVQDTHPIPDTIPDPPPLWRTEYSELADGLTETARDLPSALELLRGFWSTARDDASGASGTEH